MYTKKNSRVTFRSNRRPGFKRNNNFSNGKSGNKGNVKQQYNKYLKLAKDASTSGDRIQSEYYYQFTDHYYRLMLELGISFEDDESNHINKVSDETVKQVETPINLKEENKNIVENENQESAESENLDSIESLPFMSEPVKKKSSRLKKT